MNQSVLFKSLRVMSFVLLSLSLLYANKVPSSSNPPHGMNPEEVPFFIFIGSDDNYGSGMNPLMDLMLEFENPEGNSIDETFDGTPATMSFYSNSIYKDFGGNFLRAHHRMIDEGHEFGIHTHSHDTLNNYATIVKEIDDFYEEISYTQVAGFGPDADTILGFGPETFRGFRAPFLYVEDSVFFALQNYGIEYDCSIQDGWAPEYDGSDYSWPYTLGYGASEGWKFLWEEGYYEDLLRSYPDVWEIPIHPFIIPDDSYSQLVLGYSLRDKVKDSEFLSPITVDHKIIGLDWDVLFEAKLDSAETLAILKYNFDLRINGNRAPLNLGIHSPYYQLDSQGERNRGWLREFLNYALEHPATRIVSGEKVIDWMKDPVALDGSRPTVSIAQSQMKQTQRNWGVEGRYFWTGEPGLLSNARGQKVQYRLSSQDNVQWLKLATGTWYWQSNSTQSAKSSAVSFTIQ